MAERMCPAACDGCCDCNEFPRYHHAHDCHVPTTKVKPVYNLCRWCGRHIATKARRCDECLREVEMDRRIDIARGK